MPNFLLYSTSCELKRLIQQRFRNDIHYVWCSEDFDSTALGRYTSGSMMPPSSNPADIYRDLKKAVLNSDRHNSKINEFKASFKALATQWENKNDITPADLKDIFYMVENAAFNDWRPLLYVVHRQLVETRLQRVPLEQCASLGIEYIVPDLAPSEFDIIEF